MEKRVAFGRLVWAFLRAGWRPPTPSDRSMELILDDMSRVHPAAKLGLSAMEVEILRHMADGLRYVDIERKMGVSHETFRERQKSLFARLGARNGPHAVAEGFRMGLLR